MCRITFLLVSLVTNHLVIRIHVILKFGEMSYNILIRTTYFAGCTVHTGSWTVVSQTHQRYTRHFSIFRGKLCQVTEIGFCTEQQVVATQ